MNTPVLFCVALFSASSMAATEGKFGRRIAVLVGANQAIVGRTNLQYAHKDAERLAATLRDVGGFLPEDILVLKDPEPVAILEGIETYQQRLTGNTDDTMLLFYFSGHADPQALYSHGKALQLTQLKAKLEGGPAKLRIGIVDACHGGGWTRAKGLVAVDALEVPVTRLLSAEGTALLASSSGLERAHESDVLGASFFTHHFIAGLRGAAEQTAAGEVTLQAAYRYAHERTVRDSALAANEPQHPSYEYNFHGRAEVVLAQLESASSLIDVSQVLGPIQLIQLPSGQTVLELPAGERRVKLAVEPGRYLLRREQDGGQVYAREVKVEAGKTVEFEEASLSLVAKHALAAKENVPVAEPRRFDVTASPVLVLSSSILGTGFGGAVSLAMHLNRNFGLRVRGVGLAWAGSGEVTILPAVEEEARAWRTSALFGADVAFVPYRWLFSAERRLELQFTLGTSAALTQKVGVSFNEVRPRGPQELRWVPVTVSHSVTYYFNRRLALGLESQAYWFGSTHSQLGGFLADTEVMLQMGLTVAL